MSVMRVKKLLTAAKDAPCMACGAFDGTVVAAHRNEGKGMGIKVPDYQVAYLCFRCHSFLDSGKDMTRDQRREFWNRAYIKTVAYWFQNQVVKTA
jgi:hypothetical protein